MAASFVQSAAYLKLIRDSLGSRGRNIKIISNFENEEGLRKIGEISHHGRPWRSKHGDPASERFLGPEDDHHQAQHEGQARDHRDTGVGVHDQVPSPHTCGGQRWGQCCVCRHGLRQGQQATSLRTP
mmetsp:Transcript_56480/g.183525  ORF Transcript_56480/g.183525 Transcript_56480/m.183525 type:complete len:127 (+) Transcript_56480:335-715(+)